MHMYFCGERAWSTPNSPRGSRFKKENQELRQSGQHTSYDPGSPGACATQHAQGGKQGEARWDCNRRFRGACKALISTRPPKPHPQEGSEPQTTGPEKVPAVRGDPRDDTKNRKHTMWQAGSSPGNSVMRMRISQRGEEKHLLPPTGTMTRAGKPGLLQRQKGNPKGWAFHMLEEYMWIIWGKVISSKNATFLKDTLRPHLTHCYACTSKEDSPASHTPTTILKELTTPVKLWSLPRDL